MSAAVMLMLWTAYGGDVRAQEPAGDHAPHQPMVLEQQGSFAFGGTVITGPEGDTFHGDHGYAFFQVPVNAKRLPLVMWHGAGEFSKTWESTPDGREGYQQSGKRGCPDCATAAGHVTNRGSRVTVCAVQATSGCWHYDWSAHPARSYARSQQ